MFGSPNIKFITIIHLFCLVPFPCHIVSRSSSVFWSFPGAFLPPIMFWCFLGHKSWGLLETSRGRWNRKASKNLSPDILRLPKNTVTFYSWLYASALGRLHSWNTRSFVEYFLGIFNIKTLRVNEIISIFFYLA